MNERLRLLSGSQPVLLDPTNGDETLGEATDVFRYVDSDFKRESCKITGPPTKETAVHVYEMVRDSTLKELFGGFGLELDSLALTQAQIKQFATRQRDWLKKGGNGTFFLCRGSAELFVAAVYLFTDGRLGIRARDLNLERVFRAQKGHRVVVAS